MKILHLIQRPQLRGAETFASQIADIHKQQGHDVLFIALFAAPSVQKLDTKGVKLIELNANEKSRLGDLRGWKKLGSLIQAFNPDVVQVNAGDTLKYAVFSRMITGWKAPLVYRNANKAGDFIKGAVHKAYNKWLANKADYVASVSANCADDFIATFNYPKELIASFPIGTPVPETFSAKGNIRKELGLDDNSKLIVNIGSFVPEKNHPGLVRMFSNIHKLVPGTHLVLVGDGKLRAQVEQAIYEEALAGKVHLLGYRNDAVDILMQCNLMLMPSFIEGLPGVILEAMAHKVPVVASEIGGIPEVIINGKTGFLGNPNQPDSFITHSVNILNNTAFATNIAVQAYQFCKQHYDIHKIAADFMTLYNKVAG